MKIAILTSGILPVPAVQGGAVENLIDFYLEYNDKHRLHDITVYSICNDAVKNHPAMMSDVNRYIYIKTDTTLSRIKKHIYHAFHKEGYYHYTVEYYLNETLRLLRKESYDAIIIENRPGFALRLKPYAGKARLVYHLHNDNLNSTTKISKKIYEHADIIITVSDFIKHRVMSINDADKKCITVHNGIDTEAFAPHGKAVSRREHLGFAANDFIIIFTGRIIPEKGIAELIEAVCNLLSCNNTSIKLLIVGSPFYGNNNTDDPFVTSLKEKASLLKDNIIFTGYIPYSHLNEYLHIADAAIIPSVWNEPFGLTCIEALAAGLPVITTLRGGLPEVVNTDCAIMIETGKDLPKKLADAILYLYKNPKIKENMRVNAMKQARNFTKEKYAENFFKAIECL